MRNEDASLFFDGTCASDACIWKFFTPMQMFTNGSGNPDAGSYLNGFVSSKIPTFVSSKIPTSGTSWGGDNIVRFNSAEYDAIEAELSATALDDPNRVNLVIELNDLLTSTAVIPLIHRASPSAVLNEIQGIGDLNGWDSEYYNIEDWTRG